jgi:hypothetical protein
MSSAVMHCHSQAWGGRRLAGCLGGSALINKNKFKASSIRNKSTFKAKLFE